MRPRDVSLQGLIDQLNSDLADHDALSKITQAQHIARAVAEAWEQVIDYHVTLARASGAPWSDIGRALGVSRQAAQQRFAQPMFDALTEESRNILVLADGRAKALGHDYIGSEHLLLSMLAEHDVAAYQILVDLAGSRQVIEQLLVERLSRGTAGARGSIPLAAPAKEAIRQAVSAAGELGVGHVATEYLLLGVARAKGGLAAQVLSDLGVTSERVHDEILRRRG